MIASAPTPPAQPAPSDPLDWPLPCDITVGSSTIREGCPLRSLVSLMHIMGDAATSRSNMRAFVDEVLGLAFEGGTADGGDIQEWGVKHGVLVAVEMKEPCGENCNCARDCGEWPVTCYRKTYKGAASATRLDIMSLIHSQMHRVYASAIDREEVDTKHMTEIESAIRALLSTPPTTGATS